MPTPALITSIHSRAIRYRTTDRLVRTGPFSGRHGLAENRDFWVALTDPRGGRELGLGHHLGTLQVPMAKFDRKRQWSWWQTNPGHSSVPLDLLVCRAPLHCLLPFESDPPLLLFKPKRT
mmetsp:Transcript_27697/g.46934  ORF Transcript_27697/g.46934 Transcript_27697/m.46934 type:complete len:120 (+) Transcript_27697:256-615(+)